MPEDLLNSALEKFKDRINNTNINFYSKEKPFESSGLALYEWSPIADNLKVLDKEIVLNSIKNKWMHVINDFDKLSKNFLKINFYFACSQLKTPQHKDLLMLSCPPIHYIHLLRFFLKFFS